MESVTNIRAVASLGREKKIIEIFDKTLEEPRKRAFRKGNISGALFGFSQFSTFAIYAILFYIASIFRRDYGL